MFDLIIKSSDQEWLSSNHPDLKISHDNNQVAEISGILAFSMLFIEEGKPYIINPDLNCSKGILIQDKYKIKINFLGTEFSDLPQVYEIDSRIKNLAQIRNLRLEDLHVNHNGAACLCINTDESTNLPSGFNLKDFFNNLVVPFFYAQSYFEKHYSWPWGQYSHGVWGLIEWYLEQDDVTCHLITDFLKRLSKYKGEWSMLFKFLMPKHNIKGHHLCICGSTEKIRKCHPRVLHGIWKLKEDIKIFNYHIKHFT